MNNRKRKSGIGLNMMQSEGNQRQSIPKSTKGNKSGASNFKKRRIDVQIDHIVEIADIQTRAEFNPQVSENDASFLEDIQRNGIIQAVGIIPIGDEYSREYKLVYGHRRLSAAKMLGMSTIPAELYPPNSLQLDIDTITLAENIHRNDLNPIELAKALHKYRDRHQVSQTEIARTFGFSEAHVSRLFILMTASDELKKFIIDNNLQVSAAYKLARLGESDLARAIEALENDVPIEVVIEAISGGSSRVSENKKLDRTFSKKQSPVRKNGMTHLMPENLNAVREDLAGTKLANLSERELIVLAQVQEAENQLWNEQLPEIRRIPKTVLRDTGKVLDQLIKVYSYMTVLDQRQIKILLKAVLIATQTLFEKADRE